MIAGTVALSGCAVSDRLCLESYLMSRRMTGETGQLAGNPGAVARRESSEQYLPVKEQTAGGLSALTGIRLGLNTARMRTAILAERIFRNWESTKD